jgi:hypothetical protein
MRKQKRYGKKYVNIIKGRGEQKNKKQKTKNKKQKTKKQKTKNKKQKTKNKKKKTIIKL